MTIERRRPLPAGRYWLDVVPLFKTKWEIWRNAMSTVDSVKIEHTEHFDAVEAQSNPFGDGPVPAAPERDFVIFSLTNANVAWGLIGLPSPTIAPATVTSSADTADVPPPPPTIGEQLQAAASNLGTGAKVGMGLGVAVVVTIAGVALLKKR
jgi:hypothetical protein